MSNDFSGVYAAVSTPFDANLAVNQGLFLAHCQWLLNNGCDGLAIFGTTGEANSLTVAERIEALNGLSACGIMGDQLMPGVGCCAIDDTIELVRASLAVGVFKVLALPPFFYKGVSDDGLFAAYAEIIEKVGDNRLRLYLYNIPQLSGVEIKPELIEQLLKAYPQTVAGMKDSSGVLQNMVDNGKRFPGFSMITGADDHMLDLLKAGGAGCITAVSNLAADLAAEVFKAFTSGDMVKAEAAQEKLSEVRSIIFGFPLFAATKEVLAQHANDESWRRLRPPLLPLTTDQQNELAQQLAAIGFKPRPL